MLKVQCKWCRATPIWETSNWNPRNVGFWRRIDQRTFFYFLGFFVAFEYKQCGSFVSYWRCVWFKKEKPLFEENKEIPATEGAVEMATTLKDIAAWQWLSSRKRRQENPFLFPSFLSFYFSPSPLIAITNTIDSTSLGLFSKTVIILIFFLCRYRNRRQSLSFEVPFYWHAMAMVPKYADVVFLQTIW